MSFWIWVPASLGLGLQQQPMTLDQAVDYAVSHSFSVQVAKSNIDKAGFSVRAARGRLGPTVTVDASASRSESSIHGNVTQGGGDGSFTNSGDSKQLQLTASMPVDISGNLRRGVDIQRFAMRAAEERLESEVNTVKRNVRSAFYEVLRTEALMKVFDDTLSNAVNRLDNTKRLLAAGIVAKVNVIRADTQVSQAQSEMAVAQNRWTLAKNSFNNALARPINTSVELAPIGEISVVVLDAEKLQKTAVLVRPEIRALNYQIQALAVVRDGVRNGQAPNLNLSLTNSNSVFGGGFNNRIHGLSGGAFLNFNIFDSGISRANANAALEDENQARSNLGQLVLGVSLEVQQAVANLRDAKTRIDVARHQVELALENYRLSLVRYQEGEGIQLETIDAQTDLTRAQVGLVTSKYDYLAAWADLQKAVGSDSVPVGQEPHESTKEGNEL